MARIDADKARRARQEQRKDAEPNVLVLGGREFDLVSGRPAAFLVGIGRVQKGDLSGFEEALEAIFVNAKDVNEALRLGIDIEDLEPIIEQVFGITLGEASASGS